MLLKVTDISVIVQTALQFVCFLLCSLGLGFLFFLFIAGSGISMTFYWISTQFHSGY
jgi:4-hydroxybenzoate polyprenyltransferase